MKEGWKKEKFEDVFDLQMGKTPSRDNPSYWEGANTWVSISDMKDKKYISKSKEQISDIAVKDSGIKQVKKDTVIMSFKLSIGKTAIAQEDLFTNEAIMAFNVRNGYAITPDYIYYYLRGYKWDGANKAVMGATLNKKTIASNIFSYPPLPEQESIVAELDCLSGVIEKQKQQLKELDNLAQAIFYDMFGDPIANEKGWETCNVIEVVKMQRGFDLPVQNRNREGNVPIYGSNGIVGYHSEHKVLSGIITGRSGTLGEVYVSKEPHWPLNTTLFSVDTHGNNVVFLQYLMKNYHLERFKAGAGVPTLNRNDFHNKPIPKIALQLQEEFASKIEAIEKQKELIKQSLSETEILFNSRMDYYFN